jgi:hypothetical protein
LRNAVQLKIETCMALGQVLTELDAERAGEENREGGRSGECCEDVLCTGSREVVGENVQHVGDAVEHHEGAQLEKR